LPAAEAPLAGRRLYFVGIGGSGLSAYANIARALGAEVRGWDVRNTIFIGSLDGIEVDLGGEPTPPAGWEVVVSTAHLQRAEGIPRAQFLAELVAAQPAIVVGGAHGKTTTSAMIAFVLKETGRDPAWIIGGMVPQLGSNAGVGDGWLVVEGDESDRSIGALAPQIAVLTNIELDHHAAYASEAERSSPPGWRPCRTSFSAGSCRPQSSSSPCRVITTGRTPQQLSPRSSSRAFPARRRKRR
jgi:UDP-N-acetylmuramate--alanine ligase